MPNCARCGTETTGTYCDSCSFYVNNDQCWRCRMYLPKVELQQWRGQSFCPYCIQDIREDELKAEERRNARSRIPGPTSEGGRTPDEAPFGSGVKNPDYECDKCKNDLDIVYIVADHKFCEICFQQQIKTWKDAGIKTPPYMKFRAKEGMGLLARLIRLLKDMIREEWEKRSGKRKGDGGQGTEKK